MKRLGLDLEVMAPSNAVYTGLLRDSDCALTLIPPGSGIDGRTVRLTRERLRQGAVDLLYLAGHWAPALALLAGHGLPTKIVVQLSYLEANRHLTILTRLLCRSSKVVRVLADLDPRESGDLLTARWLGHKTTIIPPGYDSAWYPSTFDLTAYGIPAGAFSVAAVFEGREHKGMTWLIDCARRLPMDLPIHFLLVAPKSSHDRLRRLVRKIPFTQRFHLCDSVEAAPGLVACCSLLVVTGWNVEIQRRACMQCLVSGVPVVAEDVSPLNQVIRPGVNGELVPHGGTDALAHVLFELYENPERRAVLSAGARQFAEKLPSVDHVVAETAATFERILVEDGERKKR